MKKDQTIDQNKKIAIEAIKKKLVGKRLNYQEIFTLMDEISKDRLGDILTTYFVAAGFKEGFSDQELYYLTKAMVDTGKRLKFNGIVADKHSTGGLAGTRTTLILVPIIASAGFKIPKLSSKAITSPAGTADVIEVFCNATFTLDQVENIVKEVGGCIVWNGSLGLAPADDRIIEVETPLSYESFDKVIVSIIAKKVAAGSTHLIIDLPVGNTMKIRHFKDAEIIAKKFISLGKKFGIKVIVDINHALQPAARGIGPVLEARDALWVLEQSKERSIMLELKTLRLAGKLLNICYQDAKINKLGEDEAEKILKSGQALAKFKEIIKSQQGKFVNSNQIKLAKYSHQPTSRYKGKICSINNYNLNSIAKTLGAPKDKQAGIYMLKRDEELVKINEPLAIFYSNSQSQIKKAENQIRKNPIYEIEQI